MLEPLIGFGAHDPGEFFLKAHLQPRVPTCKELYDDPEGLLDVWKCADIIPGLGILPVSAVAELERNLHQEWTYLQLSMKKSAHSWFW